MIIHNCTILVGIAKPAINKGLRKCMGSISKLWQ